MVVSDKTVNNIQAERSVVKGGAVLGAVFPRTIMTENNAQPAQSAHHKKLAKRADARLEKEAAEIPAQESNVEEAQTESTAQESPVVTTTPPQNLDAPVVFFQTVEDQKQVWLKAYPKDPNYLEQIKNAYHLGIYSLSGGEPVKYQGKLVFDIDNKDSEGEPDITQSVLDGVNLLNQLNKSGVSDNQLEIFASGSKGFHVIVNGKAFGGHRATERLPDYHKYMASVISGRAGMKGTDFQMYCSGKGKLLRVANMQRKNGRYKVPITAQELRDMTPDEYEAITAQPRIRDWEIAKATDADGMFEVYREGIAAFEVKKAATVNIVSTELLEKLDGYELSCKLQIMSGIDMTKAKTASNNHKTRSMALLQDSGLASDDDVETYAENNANAKHSKSDLIAHVNSVRKPNEPRGFSCGLMLYNTGVTKLACKKCKLNPEVIEAEAKLADKKAELAEATEAKTAKKAEAVALATAELADEMAKLEATELEAADKLKAFVTERNVEHAKVKYAGKVLSMHARYETELIGENYETNFKHDFESLTELIKFASHETKFMVGDKPVNRIAAWASHRDVRAYSEVKFQPYNTFEDRSKYIPKADVYNLWQGYGVTPINHGQRYPFLARLIYKVCAGNQEWIKYLLDWIAIGFQKPQSKVGVALCIRGAEGSGKGSLLHFLRKLWGSHGGYVSNGKQVVGNFNAHLAALCYLFADEAIFAGDKAAANAIKSLITEDIIAIERKGLDITQERNYLRIAMASNHDWMVDAAKDARRFCIFDLAKIPDDDAFCANDFSIVDQAKLPEFADNLELITHNYSMGADWVDWTDDDYPAQHNPKIQAKQFYNELHAELSLTQIKEQFLFDMLTRDVSDFVPNRNIPQTEALKEQKLHTLSGDSIAMWLLHFLEEDGGEIPEFDKDGQHLITHYFMAGGVPNKILYDHYNAYCKKVDVRGFKLINPVHFGRDLTTKGVLSDRTREGRMRSVTCNFLATFKKQLGIAE